MAGVKQALPQTGRGLVARLDPALCAGAVVICAPEAWALVRGEFPAPPVAVVSPISMERQRIEAQLDALPAAPVVIGLGAGSACDAAKLHAWRSGARLVLIPSALSVDAPYTSAIGLRVGGRVRYLGRVFPEQLLIDFDLIQQAPMNLNRGGVGDVLSIATALWDWRLARDERGEAWDADIAARAQALLDRLLAHPEAIRACDEEGLQLINDCYVAEVALCERWGNSRPEEGAEHHFAYCLESITGEQYLHGALIAMAVVLTALAQGQPVEPLLAFCRRAALPHRPAEVGVRPDEIRQTLRALPAYLAQEDQLAYGIYHQDLPAKRCDRLVARLEEVTAEG